MRTCLWYDEQEDEACDSLCEGRTDLCARHNRLLRKQIADEQKAEEKRKALLSAPKKVYKAPNKVSPKRKEANKEYSVLRDEYLASHPTCEVMLLGCEKTAIEIHHVAGRGNNLNDVSTFKATCRYCHNRIHNAFSAIEARNKGLKI